MIFNLNYLLNSYTGGRWGFEKVDGAEHLTYICEAPINKLGHLLSEERTFTFGIDVDDFEKIPRGPYFVKQPENVVYDLQNPKGSKDVTMT